MFLEYVGSVLNNRKAYAFVTCLFTTQRKRMDLFDNFLMRNFIDIITRIDTFGEVDFDIAVEAITY